MKTLLSTITISLIVIAAQGQGTLTGEEAQKMIDTVQGAMEQYSQGNYDKMSEYYLPNALIMEPSVDEYAIKKWIEARKKIDQNYSDYELETYTALVAQIDGDDYVLVYGEWTMTSKLYDKQVFFDIHFTHLMRDGKIAETTAYYDRMAILERLGFQVLPPQVASGNK